MAEKYITEEQRAKCRKVADAFAELYELADVMVADAGRFGFVRLQWFSEGEGFDSAMAFSDSMELFEELWRIWYEHEVLTPVLGTPLAELDYDEIFQTLSKDRQEEILEKKKYFISRCEDAFGKAADIFYNSGAFSVKIDRIRIKEWCVWETGSGGRTGHIRT